MVAATQTQVATYLDETADVLATAYGVTVDDALNAKLAALYEGDSLVQSEAAWREIRRTLWDGLEPARWPHPELRFNQLDPMFSDEDIIEIRERYAAGGVTQQQVADAFGCSQHHVSDIVTGKCYSKVGGPLTFRRSA